MNDAEARRIITTLNDKQKKVLAIHKHHLKGLTNWELEIICGSHNSTWRTRVSELVDYGLVVDSHRKKRIADSDDPSADRHIWIYAQYFDAYLNEPMPYKEEPAKPPPISTSARLENGRLITHCLICGTANAPFGYDVSLRNNRLGEHYCFLHRPDRET